jgi:hypothetical protein
MLVADPEVGNSVLRLWVASGSAALLVFVCALAIDWARSRMVARVAVVLVGAVLGATLAWAFLGGASLRDQGAERRVLELRATELNAQALAPGSSLACLDGVAGDTVEAACERAIFASPAAVASATSYVAARVTLLADIVSYDRNGGRNIDDLSQPLRRSLEADRFGFVAHVLALRDGCTGDHCAALALLPDSAHVRTNLSAQTLDRYLDRYASAWTQQTEVPVADAAATSSAGAASPSPGQAGLLAQKKVLIDGDFPSAASIPAVSIMNPEPKAVPPSVAAAANAHAAAPARPNRKQAATSSGQPPTSPTASSVAPADPVWTPGAAAVAPQPSQPPPTQPPPPQPAQTTAGAAAPAQ